MRPPSELVEKPNPEFVIRSDKSKLPPISPTLNDGVVNTVRQIVNPDEPGEIGASWWPTMQMSLGTTTGRMH